MTTKKHRRAPKAARPRRAHRQNPPPRKGALIEVERRDGTYWFRHPMGHLAGPHRSRAEAMTSGARAFAAALNPAASRAELTELAAALMEEDPERPYTRQFADGWRVWDPARRIFLRGPDGAPFATRGEAERRRRELAGEASDDGPMFRRAPPAPVALDLFASRPARGGGGAPMQQLGLFGARENPSPAFQSRAQRAVEHIESVLGGILDGLSRVYGPTVPSVATVTWPSTTRVAKLLALDATGMEQMVAGAEIRVRAVSPSGQSGVVARSVAVALDAKGTYVVVYMRKGKTGAKSAQVKLALVDGIGHAAGDAVAAFFARTHAPARENPSALGPLRGAQGEAVVYRPRGDGTVIVRASHAGAGTSDREMTLAGALEHRARLLRLGYRANPAPRPTKARRAAPKPSRRRPPRSTRRR